VVADFLGYVKRFLLSSGNPALMMRLDIVVEIQSIAIEGIGFELWRKELRSTVREGIFSCH
jgi:hypothetical protein